jgi:spore coat protein CotH
MKRSVNALSFTPKYDELEDRIRLSINYEDMTNRVDFMLSRAFILRLFPVLDDYMMKFYESDLEVQKNFKEAIKENIGKDKTTSMADEANLTLYRQEDELLVDLSFSHLKKNNKTLIKFHSQKTEASVELDAKAMKQIFTIIKSTIPFFSWGISYNF